MDSQESKSNYKVDHQRAAGFLNPLQMSMNGSFMSMADAAMYSNALSRFTGSLQGGSYDSAVQTLTLPQPNVRQSLPMARKSDSNPLGDAQRGFKRRKEDDDENGNNQGSFQLLPAYGNLHQVSLNYHTLSPQQCLQQALLQHAQQGLHQSQLLTQRSPSDASTKLSIETVHPSPNRLSIEATHPSHNRLPTEATHPSHNRLPLEATHGSHNRLTMENMHPSPSRLSSEAINPSPSRLSLEGSPRSSIQKPTPSLHSVQVPTLNSQPSSVSGPSQVPYPGSQVSDVPSRPLAVKEWGNKPLSNVDPQLFDIMEREKTRQWKGIELIASENFTSQAVMEVLGSHLTNKYSEGLPGARYYGGNEYIDQIETLCRERALIAFHLDPESWGVNVQPYSCTSANFAVYTALLQPKDRIMGLDSPSGGHLSHGYYTSSGKKVSAASIFFENLPYKVNPETGYIDYEKLEEKALNFCPKILICGGSAYPREWDYARFRQIADKAGAILMCDMAHISGLVAAQECANPFSYCDIVTSTTHKSLRGPRGGMIFYRKGLKQKRRIPFSNSVNDSELYDYEDRVNFAVFPSLQGGPHNNQIAALAVALKQVSTPEYKAYIQQVKKNAQALIVGLQKRGCKLVTDGTDNHLLLWDLRSHGLTGYRFEKVCELCHMTLNKNAVYGDSGTFAPGGVRIGTLAMTSRGCVEGDFETIAEFLFRALQIAINVQRENGKQHNDFLKGLKNSKDIEDLKHNIEKFASTLEMPGFDTSVMKFNH